MAIPSFLKEGDKNGSTGKGWTLNESSVPCGKDVSEYLCEIFFAIIHIILSLL
jgi:hypothetical protein